ncbi:MAG: response regulator, partial [Gammaproteobacteria bacterium]|nr:response regulator [Gammaproteobacteria bacterium]
MPTASIQARIVLVEDDLRLSELVRSYLDAHGFAVSVESRGDRVADRVRTEQPDLVVLDLGLPGKDGLTVCRELRAEFGMPILILTSRDNDIDHVVGLELGADDYVIKPVEPRVLVARIQALLRRSRPVAGVEQARLRFGSLTIDPARAWSPSTNSPWPCPPTSSTCCCISPRTPGNRRRAKRSTRNSTGAS